MKRIENGSRDLFDSNNCLVDGEFILNDYVLEN